MITGTCYRCKGTGCIEYPALTRVLEAVSPTEWSTTQSVSEALDRDATGVDEQLKDLLHRGLIERRGYGRRGSPYEWRRTT